jgi:Holliday junction resolvasome RuvABC endonuclease subunit
MSVVLGVDLAYRSIAMVALGSNLGVAKKASLSSKVIEPQQIASRLFAEALPFVQMVQPTIVCIEEPLLGLSRNIQTALKIGRTCGVLMGVLASVGMERGVYLVPVSEWKAEVIGHGGSDKQRVRTWLDKNKPKVASICGDDQDLRDAACLALYGQRLLGRVDAVRSGLLDEPSHATVAPRG